MKVVYMGTPDFAVPALETIAKEHEIGYVVTQQDKPKNRGKKMQPTPVKEKALELGLEVLQPEKVKNNEEFINMLREYAPDVIVVAAYGKIIPKVILDLPLYGCINIHASLLPKYRGAAPIQRSILSGDEKTGVTIMRMAEGVDTGNMLMSKATDIGRKTSGMLHEELAVIGSELIVEVLKMIEEGNPPEEVVQDDSLATHAPMIFKQDGIIDFSLSAEEIERKTRALDPWPGAFTTMNGETFKIWEAEPVKESSDEAPGTVVSAGSEGIGISTGEGILMAKVIQVPGKKRVAVSEFLKGNRIEKGIKLG